MQTPGPVSSRRFGLASLLSCIFVTFCRILLTGQLVLVNFDEHQGLGSPRGDGSPPRMEDLGQGAEWLQRPWHSEIQNSKRYLWTPLYRIGYNRIFTLITLCFQHLAIHGSSHHFSPCVWQLSGPELSVRYTALQLPPSSIRDLARLYFS